MKILYLRFENRFEDSSQVFWLASSTCGIPRRQYSFESGFPIKKIERKKLANIPIKLF